MAKGNSNAQRSKYVVFVMCAQVACVAIGLWVQHRFSYSTVQRSVEDQAWQDLADGTENVIERVRAREADGDAAVVVARASEVISQFSFPSGADLAITDAQWRVIRDWPRLRNEPQTGTLVGQSLTLAPLPDRAAVAPQGFVGTIILPGGPHVAVARHLPNESGYVIAHLPVSELSARTAVPLQSLPIVGVTTLIWTCALLAIAVYMILSKSYQELALEQKTSEAQSLRRIQSLVRTRDAVIFGLAKLADSRDPETGDHLERISLYSSTLASLLARKPKFADVITPGFVRTIGISSVLHDIGKVGIEDSVLRKPGKLTPEERKRMQQHTIIGGQCIQEIEQRLGSSNFLQMAREIAFSHHERWDGTGYPEGLKDDCIPLSARVVAIVDVYDALSSKRVYKDAMPHARCVEIIREGSGTHFDPDLVDIWLSNAGRFREIARRYVRDTEPAVDPAENNTAAAETAATETAAPRKVDPLVPAMAVEER